ncbi:hypothetical protein Ddye_002456 [Dipteronia dyeriana]|uniref:NAC domain-containing protein n=1 Tax=Dipteronia dyeriana TaxID=168575 RepID=A0AAE0CUE5_9ROSI|nr:hypothetical protein Ddye_002456 [Dipteronia dyeriana]
MVIPVVDRFRPFRPIREELAKYVKEKMRDPAFTIPYIKDDNIYKYHPSELPGLFSSYQSDDQVWYFFCTLENKYGKSDKFNRIAKGGYWKKTGGDLTIEATDSNKPIGIRKILVFKDYDDGKENKTSYTMHEYHDIHEDHFNEQPVSIGQVVLCRIERNTEKKRMRKKRKPSRIERKPDKKRKPYSPLEKGQTSDSLAYDSGNNVAQDILEVDSQLQPNQHIPCVTKNIFPEVRPPVPALQDELIDCNGVCHKSLSTFQSPIYETPGSFYSSSFSNDSAHWLVHNSFSALQSPIHLPPESFYSGSFSNNLTNGLKLDHTSFTSLQWPIPPQPGSSYSSVFSNNSTNGLDHNSFSALQFQIPPPLESPYSSGYSNGATNGLNHSSFSSLQSPIHPQPGSSHSSGFSNGSDVWTPQFASEQHDDFTNSQLMEVKSDQLQSNQHTSHVTTNVFPKLGSQLLPNQHISSNGEDHVAKYIHHQNPSNGLDHNSFSALRFPIHSPLESLYSSGFSNDTTNGLNHSCFSSLQSPIHPQPGSSHSSCFSNGSNVWTPRSASEQEDDLANSRHMEVKSDRLQPNQHTSHVTTNDFPKSESQLPPKQHISSNGEDLVAKKISFEKKSQLLPEPKDISSELEPPVAGKWDAIDGRQLPISSVYGDDSIVRKTLLVSELGDAFQILEGVHLDDIFSET